MNTLTDYCLNNINKLINYQQSSFEWRNNYDVKSLIELKDFKNIEADIPSKLNRQHIICLIKSEKFYQAFVEIMLWGHVGAVPGANKSKKTAIAKKIFKFDINKIKNIFQIVNAGNINEIRNLYFELEKPNGFYKIPGVGVSYFTKILSFASEASDASNLTLLIYDKWTKLIHVHLLFDNKNNGIIDSFFSKVEISNLYSKSKGENLSTTKLISPKSDKTFEAYINFCELINSLAKTLSDKSKNDISAFQLEGFLFGNELRGKINKVESNPRFWAQQNLANNYLLNYK